MLRFLLRPGHAMAAKLDKWLTRHLPPSQPLIGAHIRWKEAISAELYNIVDKCVDFHNSTDPVYISTMFTQVPAPPPNPHPRPCGPIPAVLQGSQVPESGVPESPGRIGLVGGNGERRGEMRGNRGKWGEMGGNRRKWGEMGGNGGDRDSSSGHNRKCMINLYKGQKNGESRVG